MKSTLVAVTVMAVLVACGEKPQTVTSSAIRKSDTKAWQAAQNPFVAPGWKSGDQASWELQMRNRSLGQNEYSRVSPRP
jgi:hypothetical protein